MTILIDEMEVESNQFAADTFARLKTPGEPWRAHPTWQHPDVHCTTRVRQTNGALLSIRDSIGHHDAFICFARTL